MKHTLGPLKHDQSRVELMRNGGKTFCPFEAGEACSSYCPLFDYDEENQSVSLHCGNSGAVYFIEAEEADNAGDKA